MSVHTFRTPKGNTVRMACRDGTVDHNSCQSILVQDEYRIAGADLHGLVLDVGAYVGGFTLAVLVDHPGATVVAIEALPANVAMIERNLDLNGIDRSRVEVVHGAATAPGVAWVDIGLGGEVGSIHEHIGGPSPIERRPVRGWSYGALVGTADVVFVKIDCEGCEWQFLRDPAVARVDRIIGEYHPDGLHAGVDLEALLGVSHVVTFDPIGPGLFEAVRR